MLLYATSTFETPQKRFVPALKKCLQPADTEVIITQRSLCLLGVHKEEKMKYK